MSGLAAPFLTRLPFLYPACGAVALLYYWDIGLKALGYALLQVCLPLYWISHRLSEKHHEKVFAELYSRRVGASTTAQHQAVAISPRQAAALAAVDAVTSAASAPVDAPAGSAGAATTPPHAPLVAALLFLIRPPPTAAGWVVSSARRAVAAPLGLAFPALPRIAAVLSTGHLGSAWMAPYLRAARKGRGGMAGAAALARAGPTASAAFGLMALLLGCVPVLSRLLAFFTAAGAALWAADLAAGAT